MQRIAALQLRNLVTPDWVTFALLSATLLVVIRSVEAAGWAVHPPLSMTVLLAAFTGLLAARLPWRAWQRHLAGAAMGLLVVYLQTASLVEAEGLARQFAQLNDRLAAWWSAATGDGVNPDPLPFSLLLTVVAWAAGYLAAWVVFQSGNIWLAILPASLGLVTNLTYLPPSYVGYLFPFLLVTMLLLVRLTALQRRASLGRSEIGYPSSLPHLSLGAAFVLSSLIVFAVALLPDHSFRVEPLRRVWNASRQPAEWVQEQFTRLFPGITGIKPSSASPFGAVFALIANAPTSEDTVFAANAPFATYWRVRSYSTYTAGGWSTGQTTIQPALQLGVDLDLEISDDPGTYYYEIQTHVPAPYLFLPSATPLSVNIPARLETLAKNEELAAMVAVRPQNPLEPKETYNGLFTLALPPEQLLREPTTEYPDWVLRQYLQLPSSLPSRVRNEAASLTRGLDRSYDKAVAIEAFLREKLTYTANAPPAPAGADPIEHFLFEAREGHGGHFASAMTVMLRSLGIPTRLVSGYGPGVPDEDEGVYLIRQKDRHYWPEAYF
ncbi:MAG: hypothetical protein HY535_06705, partial [Chloroflexi bacterium]|nr:hypothetical protein [Chloroflexota bacterium]